MLAYFVSQLTMTMTAVETGVRCREREAIVECTRQYMLQYNISKALSAILTGFEVQVGFPARGSSQAV